MYPHLGPMQVCTTNGILTDSVVFAGFTDVTNTETDTQTDQATSQRAWKQPASSTACSAGNMG